MTRRDRFRRMLPWLPAMAVFGVAAASAVGLQAVPGAIAASGSSPQTQSVTVTATVNPYVTLDVTGCGSGALTLSAIAVNQEDTDVTATACTATFSTNNGSYAELQVHDSNTTAAFLCQRATATGACAGGSFGNPTNNIANMEDGTVGFTPVAPTSCTLQGLYNAGSNVPSTNRFLFADSASALCRTSGTATGTAGFDIYLDTLAAQTAGTYRGQMTLTAVAAA